MGASSCGGVPLHQEREEECHGSGVDGVVLLTGWRQCRLQGWQGWQSSMRQGGGPGRIACRWQHVWHQAGCQVPEHSSAGRQGAMHACMPLPSTKQTQCHVACIQGGVEAQFWLPIKLLPVHACVQAGGGGKGWVRSEG
jgi:hypothetical protein